MIIGLRLWVKIIAYSCIMLHIYQPCISNTPAPSLPTYYSIRSQGFNAARHVSGWLAYLDNISTSTSLYGTFAAIPSYTRSFRPDRISHCLFGNQLNNHDMITISGSQIENRNCRDWLADYFYLPTDFLSTICFKPKIDNFIVDLDLFLGLNDWAQGMYFYIYAPIVHTRWNLHMHEHVIQRGINAHPAGYFAPESLSRGQLLNNFTEFANGCSTTPIDQQVVLPIDATTVTQNFNTVLQPLKHAKMSRKEKNATRCADLRVALGRIFACTDDFHMGFNIQAAGPTGNRPCGEFLFEPVVGNGHHWELGGALQGHYTFFTAEDESFCASIYGQADITYLFSALQKRTFDLVNGPASRYMLMSRLGNSRSGTPIVDNLMGGGHTPIEQFQMEFAPVANISTLLVNVHVGVQADILVLLNITADTWSWDFGYSFWARECERISLVHCLPFDSPVKWALKGDAQVIGFTAMAEAGVDPLRLPANTPIPLSATEHEATLHAGVNLPRSGAPSSAAFNAGRANPFIDGALPATAGPTVPTGSQVNISINPDSGTSAQINTSINPIVLGILNLDVCNAITGGKSSKIFTHLNYTWKERTTWTPYFGIGAEVEFDHSKPSSKTQCHPCALSQWGIWFKGGIAFE